MKTLYIVIVTYNAVPWIKRCIDSIIQSTIDANIIVVDNCSTDDTLSLLENLYPDVQIFAQSKNLGFGQANNIGIVNALENGADYVYLLNQDAWVQPQTFEILIQTHRSHPEFGIISPMHTTATIERLDNYFALSCNSKTCQGLIDDLYFNRTKDIYQIDFVAAAHWLISRECLMAVGGFSPTFFHYAEDDNYINRAFYHNFNIGICPKTSAVHDREFRKESTEKQIYKVFTMIVCHSSKIMNFKITTILASIYYLFKVSLKNKSLLAFLYFFRFLFMLPKIIRNRKISKRRYPNFLFKISTTSRNIFEPNK